MKQHNTPALPVERAFVVQFSHGLLMSGRVEHIVTGNAGRFASWDELQSWMNEALARTGRIPSTDTEPGGGHD
jgi:hypothetical protein